MAIDDLICAKKTQRDKDWPMIRRLIEAHFAAHRDHSNADQRSFWLREGRTAELLVGLSKAYPELAGPLSERRPLLRHAIAGDCDSLEVGLITEQEAERKADRAYWQPLKRELEELGRQRR